MYQSILFWQGYKALAKFDYEMLKKKWLGKPYPSRALVLDYFFFDFCYTGGSNYVIRCVVHQVLVRNWTVDEILHFAR